MESSGIVFDLRRYSIHDGPGIRTTVFLKGCPLACKWCHNPEGRNFQPELIFRSQRCILCDDCLAVCPNQAISREKDKITIDRGHCKVSGQCALVCPTQALEIAGREMTVEELMVIIEKDQVFYSQSGGGVTFSGGEPLAQPLFLKKMLAGCKEKGFSTTVDACGFSKQSVFENIFPFVDLFLFDIKLMDEARHISWTGVSNTQILANLRWVSEQNAHIIVRMPIIVGVNSDDENIQLSSEFLASLPNIPSVEFLPYHDLGKGKYSGLGKDAEYLKMKAPDLRLLQHYRKIFSNKGIQVLEHASI
jgi:pyruvate formate lyase activating enzyme